MTGTERYRKKKSDKYAEKGRGREIRKGGEKRKSFRTGIGKESYQWKEWEKCAIGMSTRKKERKM